MTDRTKGQILVTLQFTILAAMLFSRTTAPNAWGDVAFAAGQLLFIGGGVLVIVAFRALGQSLTANPVPLEKGELVTTGIYSRVRHPIYAGLLMLTLGMVLSSGYWLRAVEWLLLVALLTYKIRFEESLLVKRYPAYAQYMRTVPALLPRR